MKEFFTIDLKGAPVLGAQAKAYLKGELNEFISFTPDEEGFEEAIKSRKKFTIDRKLLVKILEAQNSHSSEKTKKNISLLKNENAFTVTTGHQLCLFTGPLYFIYKILHAIKLSEELKWKFPDNDFVPVYWMASEDHDFAEVNHTFVFGKKLEWNGNVKGAVGRTPLSFGHLPLERGEAASALAGVLNELKTILGESDKAKEIYTVIEKCYSQNNLSEATRSLVNYLFSEFGLVVLDADDKELKKEFSKIFIQEINDEFVVKAVTESSLSLEKRGFKPQVNPREINIFYLAENSRERIIRDNEVYVTADYSKRWNKEELLKEIESNPENFSPNVLMRALYQETILPNITYIGGGGEISYWLQMKKMFEMANVFFPVLTVRNSFLLMDQGTKDKVEKLGFTVMDFFDSEENLVNLFIERNKSVEINFEGEIEKIRSVYQQLAENIAKVDPTLKATTEAELQKNLKSFESLETRVRKAEKQKHDQSLSQIKNIKAKLFPDGEFQERNDNFLQYWLKTEGKLIEELYGMMGGVESELRVVG